MRSAVIYPETYDIAKFGEKRKEFPPFGVMYLAAGMELAGIDTEILRVSSDRTTLNLVEFDIVAFSTPSSVAYPAIKKARFASIYKEDALILVGGVHASLYPEETLIDLEADVVGIGEGDITLPEILEKYDTRDFHGIRGICYVGDSKPVLTAQRPLVQDIDHLPFPARHLMDTEDLILTDRLAKTDLRMTHIMLSRGCPFSCHFCAAPQKTVQYRSGNNVRSELSALISEYGIQGFSVVDDNSMINRKVIVDICHSISDLGLKWSTVSRVDTVDAHTLELMKNAGCIEIAFGVESGSEQLLRAMNKNISVDQILQAVTQAYSVGIGVKIFLVHGFPGENRQTTGETIHLLEKMGDMVQRVSLFRFVPLPGSHVYRNRKRYGLHIDDAQGYALMDWTRFHIHHNDYHWWGTLDDFEVMNESYQRLECLVRSRWPSRHVES